MKSRNAKLLGVLCFLLLVAIAAIYISVSKNRQRSQSHSNVQVRLKWLHQAQFAGFYAAEQRGFYRQEGLTVSLKPGGVEFPAIQAVTSGAEEFGVAGADQIILSRAQGAPVVAVAVIYRVTPMVLFSFSESNIRTAADLAGRRVGVKLGGNEELTYRAILRAAKVDASTVHEVPVKYDMTPLFEKIVDVWPGYLINEVLVARERGRQVAIINPKDYGVTLYADTLFTTEKFIKENPEVVLKFTRATLKGWQFATENPDETTSFVLAFDSKLQYPHERAMLQESIPLLKPDSKPIGWMDRNDWEELQKLLLDLKFMKSPIDVDKAFDLQFIRQIYAKN
jgi:NitT/TauT family transport system substrate-binding protein